MAATKVLTRLVAWCGASSARGTARVPQFYLLSILELCSCCLHMKLGHLSTKNLAMDLYNKQGQVGRDFYRYCVFITVSMEELQG